MNALILLGIAALFMIGGKSGGGNWVEKIKQALIKLMVPGADRRLFSGFTQATFSWIRNPACWVRSYNWTGYAAGINGLGGVGGGTLITRRHILLANHVQYPALPFDIFFVNASSRTIQYKVTAVRQVGDTDIAIGTLDRDADPSLTVYKILPDNWQSYAKLPLPVLYSNQDRNVSTADVSSVDSGTATVRVPAFEVARSFGEAIRGGDSGNPIFVQVGGELVLLGAWWKQGYVSAGEVGYFPWVCTYRGAIESITGQKLQTADLSGFDKVS